MSEREEIARRQAQLDRPAFIVATDPASPDGDMSVTALVEATERGMKFIAALPGPEPVSMTTHKGRVIIAQGNRLYELKQEVHDQWALIQL